jgi:hypothetical protein
MVSFVPILLSCSFVHIFEWYKKHSDKSVVFVSLDLPNLPVRGHSNIPDCDEETRIPKPMPTSTLTSKYVLVSEIRI